MIYLRKKKSNSSLKNKIHLNSKKKTLKQTPDFFTKFVLSGNVLKFYLVFKYNFLKTSNNFYKICTNVYKGLFTKEIFSLNFILCF